MDIVAWLASIGLERYGPAFRENKIELDVVSELTEADLVTLGLPLGPRRKLLKAIVGLREGAPPLPEVPASAPLSHAERRQLTVMFCDLVGSTALSARLDPEDLRAVIGAYHRCCAEVIERSGGFIAKYMGDGVLAYFGYPRADEHDAERAVRAGLQLVEAVAGLDTAAAVPLQVRVGIGTGLVVVGDLIGQGAAQEQAVGGETSRPNRVNHLSRFVPTLDTREALVQARFSPNRQGSPVAGESGPMPPEFRGRVLRRRRAGPPMPDIAILYLG